MTIPGGYGGGEDPPEFKCKVLNFDDGDISNLAFHKSSSILDRTYFFHRY